MYVKYWKGTRPRTESHLFFVYTVGDMGLCCLIYLSFHISYLTYSLTSIWFITFSTGSIYVGDSEIRYTYYIICEV